MLKYDRWSWHRPINEALTSHFSWISSWLLRCSTCRRGKTRGRCQILFKLLTEFNPLSADPTKWSNILRQFVGKLPTNCLSVFDHFVGLALKGLRKTTNFYFPWNEETVLCWFQEEEKLFNLLKFAWYSKWTYRYHGQWFVSVMGSIFYLPR